MKTVTGRGEGENKTDIYYAHVFAVQLGEPGVVGNGCHDDCQVPGTHTHTHTGKHVTN